MSVKWLSVLIHAAVAAAGAAPVEPVMFEFTWTAPDGSQRTHDAMIQRPEPEAANGYAVFMIGGGAITDIDWTVTGRFEWEGEIQQHTIDGHDTKDAKTIATALVDAGFMVVRWSSIHRDDQLHAQNPAVGEPVPYDQSVSLARAALDAFVDRKLVEPDHVILLGHSLGATRACHILAMEDRPRLEVAGFVFLAGAYLSRVGGSPTAMNANAFVEAGLADIDQDAVISLDEFNASMANPDVASRLGNSAFGAVDVDRSDGLRGWEVAAALWLAAVEQNAGGKFSSRWTQFEWPVEELLAQDAPVLVLLGGLDPISVHGPLLQEIAREDGLADLTVKYFPELGHQLGPIEADRTGPIAERVVQTIAGWLDSRFEHESR